MGQQQLLLLVLATVIVGLATVAGIQAFEQGSVRANQDALTQTAVKIASDMQAQAKKPTQFGGEGATQIGSGGGDGEGVITLSDMGYETSTSSGFHSGSSTVYETSDGECSIEEGDTSNSTDLEVLCESSDAKVVVTIGGLDSDEVETTTQEIK